MNEVFLCLGGNLGNRLENIEKAIFLIQKKAGKLVQTSSVYETAAWGSNSQNKYLNLCVQIETALNAPDLLTVLLAIEQKLGRNRGNYRNSDRTIDIDILLFNQDIIHSKTLTVPHPRMAMRKFVLIPLSEISEELKHPVLKQKISTLLKKCTDKLPVHKYIPNSTQIICIEGNIGSGKTTVAKELAKILKADLVCEKFEHNPLLPLFYKNSKTYALALEISFLLERFNHLYSALQSPNKYIVCDYSIYKCLWFANANLTGQDLAHFSKLFHTLSSELPKPHLLVNLKTSTSNLENNILKRARPYEKAIPSAYLEKINRSYKKGLKTLKDIDQLEFEVKNYDRSTSKQLSKKIIEYLK